MSYVDNPYNSEIGKNLLKKNLHNIFITGEADNTFESEDKALMVSNFRQRTKAIIGIMKRFAKGYEQIRLGDSFDSGIYVCPNPDCLRRDFIYSWESVDLGIYTPNEWLGSVKLTKGRTGLPRFGHGKFVVMHRVRCNTVSTCNKCHTTFQGKVGHCQNPSCSGASEYMVTVGCGEEACGMHYIAEKTLNQQYPTNQLIAGWGRMTNRNVQIWRHGGFGGGRMTDEQGTEKAFELIQPVSGPVSGRPATLTEVERATPTMRITYGASGQTDSTNYSLSLYRFGFSQVPKRFCRGRIQGDGLPAHGGMRVDLTADNGSEVAECPNCGAMEPPAIIKSRELITPRSLLIENPQPLVMKDLLSSHQGSPVWQIYVSDPNDARERSNFLVPVAQTWNLQTIPTEATLGDIGIGLQPCPNDVGFGEEVKNMRKTLGAQTRNILDYLMLPRARIINLDGSEHAYADAKRDKEIPSLLSRKWNNYVVAIKSESGDNVVVGGIESAEDGNEDWELTLKKKNLKKFSSGLGESGPGFTYAVCEGRSKAAFQWDGKWVDCSPQCQSFRNQDGTTRNTLRHYPRFNQYPNWYEDAFQTDEWQHAQRNLIQQRGYVPPDSSGFEVGQSYLWMDELSHLIMDPLRYGPIMNKAVSDLQTYHSVYSIAEELDISLMIRTVINECRTCKGAYQAGGMEISRQGQGYVDAAGIVLMPFIYAQEVFDLEMEYQAEFGMNAVNKPIAWGVEDLGKKMLRTPTQIRID